MSSQLPVVVLVTHSADFFTVDRVSEALVRRGVRPFRVDTDRFPGEVRLSARLGKGSAHHQLFYGGASVSAGEVQAVWARKFWRPALSEELDPRFREACERESAAALSGFFDGLGAARWVNELSRQRLAEDKLRQLRLAAAAGLELPRTLLTNDPEEARRFFGELEGAVVAKMLTPLTTSMEGDTPFVYTSEVREEDLAEAELLRHSPMLFQERISKARELRVAFVEGELFTGAIDASGSTAGAVDWRRSLPGECRWVPDEVPEDTARGLRALMSALGLAFGAIDLICTPEGGHVFLEVNPAGEWGMLERDLDLPIAEAIAAALLRKGTP